MNDITINCDRPSFTRDSSDDFRQRKRFRRLLVVAELLELCVPDSLSHSTSSTDEDCLLLNSPVSAMSTRELFPFYSDYSHIMLDDRKSLLFLKLCPHNKRRPNHSSVYCIPYLHLSSCIYLSHSVQLCVQRASIEGSED